MDAERWSRVDRLVEEAMDLPADNRTAFVEAASYGDPTLRRAVLDLLAADEAAGEFLETPLVVLPPDAWPEPDAPPQKTLGPYRLLQSLGYGGMGTVYLAERREGFRRRVAIKLLRSDLPPRELESRLQLERQVLADLEHPYIARLYDGGTTDHGQPYLVLEYVEGLPIDRYCEDRSLSVGDRLRLFLKVCDAVDYAHRNLLVHRDLKPSNILVTEDGEPKLLDFGIAKLLDATRFGMDEPVTHHGLRPMTPEYASPEQIRGGSITTASDLYGLGALLFRLLAGRSPYRLRDDLPHAVEAAVIEQEPVRASEVVESSVLSRRLRGDLDTILAKALRKDPERRYGSVRELADDLTRHLEHRPVLARPESLSYRLGKLLRRHAVAAPAVAVLILLVVGFAVFAALQSHRLARERDVARSSQQRAERTSELLFDLLASPAPAQSQGEELTVRQVLDRGAERLDGLDDQPELQADSRAVIGDAYRELGLLDAAESLLRDALRQRREIHGDKHPDVAESLHGLAELHHIQGHYELAEEEFGQARDLRREILGPAHGTVAESMEGLGLALYAQGRFTDAEAVFREALDIAREYFGPRSRQTADLINDLALSLHDQVRLDEAEAAYRESLELTRAVVGNRHPAVASTINNLAVLLHDRGDLDGAAELHAQSLELRRRLYGDRHPQVALTAYNVARLVHRLGRWDEAEALYREAVDIGRSVLGTHRYTAVALEWLGRLHTEQGHWDAAERELTESLAMVTEMEGAASGRAADLLDALGGLAEDRERDEDARDWYRRSMEMDLQLDGGEMYAGISEAMMARMLLMTGEVDEAERRSRDLLPTFRKHLEEAPAADQEGFWRGQIAAAQGVVWAARWSRSEDPEHADKALEQVDELKAVDRASSRRAARTLERFL